MQSFELYNYDIHTSLIIIYDVRRSLLSRAVEPTLV